MAVKIDGGGSSTQVGLGLQDWSRETPKESTTADPAEMQGPATAVVVHREGKEEQQPSEPQVSSLGD